MSPNLQPRVRAARQRPMDSRRRRGRPPTARQPPDWCSLLWEKAFLPGACLNYQTIPGSHFASQHSAS
ncbi:hypothetical protein ACRRTK_024136 [Alexandromys fortis]